MLDAKVKVEALTIDQVGEALAILGINLKGVVSVSFQRGCVEVVRHVVDENGKMHAAGDQACRDTLQIPVIYPNGSWEPA